MPFCTSCGSEFSGNNKFCATCGNSLTTASTTVASLDSAVKYSGFWRRFAALSIEVSFYNIVYGIIIYAANIDVLDLAVGPVFWVVSILLGFLYMTLMPYKYGGTIGKLFVGLQIRRTQPGVELSYPRCVGRYFAYLLSLLLLGIGFLIQPFTKKKQALHDMIVDTEVIDHKRRPAWHIWLINIIHVVTFVFVQSIAAMNLE